MLSSATRRLLLLGALLALGASSLAFAAEPPVLPPYNGAMVFPNIQGPDGPEEFSWEVSVQPGQELQWVDDQHAVVIHEHGTTAFTITAEQARDAEGKAVPTSLAVSGDNVVTLTVHHRAGNPAAGGAQFHYPVTAGAPFEVGYSSSTLVGPPAERDVAIPERCVVPGLRGWQLKAARTWLRKANCTMGKVRGERTKKSKVVKQARAPGTVLPSGAPVAVRLG